jgi:hypothetical protein
LQAYWWKLLEQSDIHSSGVHRFHHSFAGKKKEGKKRERQKADRQTTTKAALRYQ